jgi:hypothetical protein
LNLHLLLLLLLRTLTFDHSSILLHCCLSQWIGSVEWNDKGYGPFIVLSKQTNLWFYDKPLNWVVVTSLTVLKLYILTIFFKITIYYLSVFLFVFLFVDKRGSKSSINFMEC